MEKKQILLTLLILTFFLFDGLIRVQSSRIGQAARLKALRRAKRQTYDPNLRMHNEEWVVSDLGSNKDFRSYYYSDVGNMKNDEIKGGLPGQPPLGPGNYKFKQYSGYVNVDKLNGRSLFYYFVEAIQDPSSKRLVLWLNGGPGCSSFGMGAMVEIGPFGVRPDGRTLYSRKHSWNKVANILFLESPAGVGFSYSNITYDYTMAGDTKTAIDTYTFLINWFRRYPHYKDRDFYIAGESYAGYYIPELADTIIRRNSEADSSSEIRLKGIMIGNGIINDATDEKGDYDYVWSHALISDETYQGLLYHCIKVKNSKVCDEYEQKIGADAGKIDFYNIYSPVCMDSNSNSLSTKNKPKRFGGYDPCEEDYVDKYLNLPRVQEALHANITKLAYPWELCSPRIQAWKDSPSTMFPIYRRLIASGLRIFLYSGDADAVVPVSGTRYAIDALKLRVIKAWHPWSDDIDDVCGYRVIYDGLTFSTVRGAGHQVPQNQPSRAFALFKTFLMGN